MLIRQKCKQSFAYIIEINHEDDMHFEFCCDSWTKQDSFITGWNSGIQAFSQLCLTDKLLEFKCITLDYSYSMLRNTS